VEIPHDVFWREADSARVRNILQNPAYAGAYVYGRRQKVLANIYLHYSLDLWAEAGDGARPQVT
jgi:hypothetical protein